jgi:hypothetical protein
MTERKDQLHKPQEVILPPQLQESGVRAVGEHETGESLVQSLQQAGIPAVPITTEPTPPVPKPQPEKPQVEKPSLSPTDAQKWSLVFHERIRQKLAAVKYPYAA